MKNCKEFSANWNVISSYSIILKQTEIENEESPKTILRRLTIILVMFPLSFVRQVYEKKKSNEMKNVRRTKECPKKIRIE